VEIDLNTHDVVAQGNVKTQSRGKTSSGPGNAARSSANGRKESAVLNSGETTYGFGEDFQYTRSRDEAVYREANGTARVKQGETDIQAREIVLNDRTRDLRASGDVTSIMPVEQEKSGGGSSRSLYKATADSMVYQESDRTVTYVGKPVVMTTPNQETTRAPKIVLKLDEEGRTLRQMDALSDPANPAPEQVTVVLPKSDRAWAESFTYDAATHQYTFRGRPFRLQSTDAAGTCTESIGSFAFFISGGEVTFPAERNPARPRTQPCSAAPKK
jgi:lipopolysaccharide export system protein LptA